MLTANNLRDALTAQSDTMRARQLQRFFKTGLGEYGEGDKFLGLTMPQIRATVRPYRGLPISDIAKLLNSPYHEHRMAALILLADTYNKRDEAGKRESLEMYLTGLREGMINNWDLVDVTAPHVVGEYVVAYDSDPLYTLARSPILWERRTAILATAAFLKRGEPVQTIEIATLLLHDTHDLMHKAVGWLLREMGKRVDEQLLLNFLDEHAKEMPRTMLRYAIERLAPEKRAHYMKR